MHNRSFSSKLRSLQKGVSLLFALMSLVILGLGAVALTRSVDTGVLIMGNLAFKQDTLVAGNSGAEQAIAWLAANIGGSMLEADSQVNGYYSSRNDKLDPTGNQTSLPGRSLVNWDGSCSGTCVIPGPPPPGVIVNNNKIRWVIQRLCENPGPAAGGNLCARPATVALTGSSERGELNPGGRISSGVAGPYFRVIVRIEGPRNTVSFTESLVHF